MTASLVNGAGCAMADECVMDPACQLYSECSRLALRWHYGPTPADPDPGKMWCYDCGGEVMVFDGVCVCGCGRQRTG